MLNLKAIDDTRHAYVGPNGFNVTRGSKDTTQDPLPDQARVMWFCLKEGFFTHIGAVCKLFTTTTTDGQVSPAKIKSTFINVYSRGQQKVKDHFDRKLYDSFPEWRELVLEQSSQA